jgi:hypothetical protein
VSSLPAAGYWGNAARTVPEGQTTVEAVRNFIAEMMGGGAQTTLTIAGGLITPGVGAARIFAVDTEGAAATDDVDRLILDEVPDGGLILLCAANAARVPTLKHASGGVGQFSLWSGKDLALATDRYVLMKRNGNSVEEVRLERAGVTRRVIVATASFTLKERDSGSFICNLGAAADIVATLPSAAADLEYLFSVEEAFKIKVLGAAGDKIRHGASEGAAAGWLESDATVGRFVAVTALNTTVWRSWATAGTWTLGGP